MDMEQFEQRLERIEQRVEQIYLSVEKTRKYFLWTLIISVVVIVLPAIALAFVIPSFLNSYVGNLQSVTSATGGF